jgi:hypothetical protein
LTDCGLEGLYSVGDGTVALVSEVAIAFRAMPQGWLHAGIIYRLPGEENAPAYLIHLAFHYDLRREPPSDDGYFLVLPTSTGIPPPRLRVLAALCELVWDRNGASRIPYGFDSTGSSFDRDATYVRSSGAHGLTCTTFVLKVHELAEIELLVKGEWPVRPEDAAVKERIISYIEDRDPAHAALLRADTTSVRYRAEELAAAYLSSAIPVPFAHANLEGARIVQHVSGESPELAC